MALLLLKSISLYGNLGENIEVVIYTSSEFMEMFTQSSLYSMTPNKWVFEINDTYNNVDLACKARVDVFSLPSIQKYEKVLYLDTDILIKGDLTRVFQVAKEEILYVLEEGNITCPRFSVHFFGRTLFGNDISKYADKSAFTSGIMLFRKCDKMRILFDNIKEDIIKRPFKFEGYDQPYIVYNAFKMHAFNNKILKKLAVNNDHNIDSAFIIHHFPGYPGVYHHKIMHMTNFLSASIQRDYKTLPTIYQTKTPPIKNTSFPLVALCVSYNYFEELRSMLPCNYLHFDKIYLVTQEDDIQTVEFCKQFDNVVLLFYNFKTNGKDFDKYGAIKFAQERMFKEHPNSWYLNMDSDIVLPINFIKILESEPLQEDCIYAISRINILTSSELSNLRLAIKNTYTHQPFYTQICHNNTVPPCILGMFQLYKKQCLQLDAFANALDGDYYFAWKNFKTFSLLSGIVCMHLGTGQVNIKEKVKSYIDNAKCPIDSYYFACEPTAKTLYYNSKRERQNYNVTDSLNTIDADVWSISQKMRDDIFKFFNNKMHTTNGVMLGYRFNIHTYYTIAEVGAYKGYTTKILSNIFSKVYAIDNNREFMNENIMSNKDRVNITYCLKDIYKDTWNDLSEDVDVVFIDADHSYEGCKSDIVNSLKRFTRLEYIILDDYGVWPGVRKVVDEFIQNKQLQFETFIGLTDVPGPNNIIVKNVNEGIICSVNKAWQTKMNPNVKAPVPTSSPIKKTDMFTLATPSPKIIGQTPAPKRFNLRFPMQRK